MGVALLMMKFRKKFLTFSLFLLAIVCINVHAKRGLFVLFRNCFYYNLNGQTMLKCATPGDSIVFINHTNWASCDKLDKFLHNLIIFSINLNI